MWLRHGWSYPFAAGKRHTSRSRLLLLLLMLGLAQTHSAVAQDFQLRYADGLLSVRASNTPFNDLLAALATETGIPFSTTGDSAPPITIDIEQEPLAKAISKLAPNHMLVRAASGSDAEIVEIVLILDDSNSGSDAGGNEFLPTGAPSDEIVVEDSVPSDPDGRPVDEEPAEPVDPSMSQPPDDHPDPPPQ